MRLGLFIACAAGVLATHSAMVMALMQKPFTSVEDWVDSAREMAKYELPIAVPVLAAEAAYRRYAL